MKKFKRDQVTGLVLVAVGLFFGFLTMQFKKPFTPEYPGPKMMPMIAVFGLVVCGLGVFFEGCKKQKENKEDKVFLTKEGWKRALLTFVALCLYVFAMKYVGFLVATPVIMFFLTSYFSKQSGYNVKLWVRILFAVLVAVFIYCMYVPLFGMTLPAGLLFE